MNDLLLASLLGALLSLDAAAVGQWMFSRPIVLGPLLGFALGNVSVGFWVGAMVELIWISVIPIGIGVPPDVGIVAALSILWSHAMPNTPSPQALCLLSVAIAIPFGVLFKRLDILQRTFSKYLVRQVEAGVMAGRFQRIGQMVFAGIALSYLRSFLFLFIVGAGGGALISSLYDFTLTTPAVLRGLLYAANLMPILGMSLAAHAFWVGRRDIA